MQLVVVLYNSIRSESGRDGAGREEAMCRVAQLIPGWFFHRTTLCTLGQTTADADDKNRTLQLLARSEDDKTPAITPTGFLIKPGTKSHIIRGRRLQPILRRTSNKQLTNWITGVSCSAI